MEHSLSPQCCWPGAGVAGYVYVCGVSWNTLRDVKETGSKTETSKKGDGGPRRVMVVEGRRPLTKELGAGAVFVALPPSADPAEDVHTCTSLAARRIAFPLGNQCWQINVLVP